MKTEEVQLPAIKNDKVTELIKKSGVEMTKAEAHVSAFSEKFAELYEFSRPLAKLNKKNPSTEDVKTARTNRLNLVNTRKRSEEIKDERKKVILAEANLIQSTFNLIKDSCALTEAEYEEVEKHYERIEAAKREELKASRIELLLPYEVNIEFLPLDTMSDETFEKLLLGEQEKHQAIKELRERQEKERIAKEESEKLHKQRKESILHLWSFLDPEEYDTDFSTFGQKAWELYVSGLESHKKEADAELEKLKKESEERDKQKKEEEDRVYLEITSNQKEAGAFLLENGFTESTDHGGMYWLETEEENRGARTLLLSYRKDSLYFETKDTLEIFKTAVLSEIKSKKLEAELKAKNDAEAKAQAQKLAEEEAKQKESEKIAQLPIKEQLLTWIDTFQISKFAIEDPTAADITEKFAGFIEWSKKRVHETKDN